MKIALINPPQIFSQYQIATGVTPPLGAAYLASYCIKNGIEVQLIDAVGEGPDVVTPFREDIFLRGLNTEGILQRINPDVGLIGISNLFSFAYPAVQELARAIKKRFPNVPIVAGGAHPTHMYEEVLNHGAADFVIRGEGEIPLLELCRHLAGEIKLHDVPSLAYRDEEGEIHTTPEAPRLKDLNSPHLPFPARHLLPMENYISTQEPHGTSNGRWTSILSSRGCPYSCTFCDIRLTRWVVRSASDVVDEMEHCQEQWGINEFHFEDDNMTLKRDRLIELCDEILKRGLKVRWQTPNGIRASVTDREMLLKMKASGCCHITLAPESGSQRVLRDLMLKGNDFSHEQLLNLGREAHQLGMKVAAYFIMGTPGEKPEDLELTLSYAKELARVGVDEVAFSLLIPLPGTPIWEQVVRDFGQPDYLDLLIIDDLNRAVSWSPYLTADQLKTFRRRAYVGFYLTRILHHPVSVIKTVLNIFRGLAETKTESYLRTFLKRARWSWRQKENPVHFRSSAQYAYSGSSLKAISIVTSDILGWMRGRTLPKDINEKTGAGRP